MAPKGNRPGSQGSRRGQASGADRDASSRRAPVTPRPPHGRIPNRDEFLTQARRKIGYNEKYIWEHIDKYDLSDEELFSITRFTKWVLDSSSPQIQNSPVGMRISKLARESMLAWPTSECFS